MSSRQILHSILTSCCAASRVPPSVPVIGSPCLFYLTKPGGVAHRLVSTLLLGASGTCPAWELLSDRHPLYHPPLSSCSCSTRKRPACSHPRASTPALHPCPKSLLRKPCPAEPLSSCLAGGQVPSAWALMYTHTADLSLPQGQLCAGRGTAHPPPSPHLRALAATQC